jgi:hypothetical protein
VCALVQALPQHIKATLPGTHLAQGSLSNIPIHLAMSTQFRLCVALASAYFTLNIPQCIAFIDSYINNPNNMSELELDADKTTAVRKMLETAERYLVGEGLDVFLAAKISLESDCREHDVMVSFSTPSCSIGASPNGLDTVAGGVEGATCNVRAQEKYSAVKISATAGLYDLLDDINALMSIDISPEQPASSCSSPPPLQSAR